MRKSYQLEASSEVHCDGVHLIIYGGSSQSLHQHYILTLKYIEDLHGLAVVLTACAIWPKMDHLYIGNGLPLHETPLIYQLWMSLVWFWHSEYIAVKFCSGIRLVYCSGNRSYCACSYWRLSVGMCVFGKAEEHLDWFPPHPPTHTHTLSGILNRYNKISFLLPLSQFLLKSFLSLLSRAVIGNPLLFILLICMLNHLYLKHELREYLSMLDKWNHPVVPPVWPFLLILFLCSNIA